MLLLHNIRKKLNSFQRSVGRRTAKLNRRLDAAPPVAIFQMGKVGSTSLKDSLTPIWPGLTIHTHNIMKDVERNRQSVKLVYERVIRKGGPLFIISPVREPIGRNVSAFFENFQRHTGLKYNESTVPIDELIRLFLEKLNHGIPLTWFDRILKPVLGIDVYQYEFPSNGIQVIQHDNTKLLLMRCELPDHVKESAVKDFLALPVFSLSNWNVGSQKPYAETYRNFRRAFVAPDWLLARAYQSRFFNHFYGDKLRENLIRKWTQKGGLQHQQDSTGIFEDLVDFHVVNQVKE